MQNPLRSKGAITNSRLLPSRTERRRLHRANTINSLLKATDSSRRLRPSLTVSQPSSLTVLRLPSRMERRLLNPTALRPRSLTARRRPSRTEPLRPSKEPTGPPRLPNRRTALSLDTAHPRLSSLTGSNPTVSPRRSNTHLTGSSSPRRPRLWGTDLPRSLRITATRTHKPSGRP
jgi:hypothetical protein